MANRYPTVLLFGAPGVGKGTQGNILGSIPGLFHLSCGDMFRMLDVDSELGRTFYEYSSRGELVPDDITVQFWQQNIHARTVLGLYKPKTDLLILDGIPRNLNQAQRTEKHIQVLKVIHLVCRDENAMIQRIRQRALKENRIDDAKEDIIRRRWDIYRTDTQPVLEHYSERLVAKVNAVASHVEVLSDILQIIIPVVNQHFSSSEQN
ncbi:adenylate kinase [Candidatus Poribacteria bacterium]|nr:adenylate kinase [Candidatus Poribacteria bacterium]MDP6746830.1 nucleoside monophosphate kinase [Candidatus Poribacteria bacterium]MDP6994620.1 nucleoside monophosphate kinase [Candidatus Poribacteria bacterium]